MQKRSTSRNTSRQEANSAKQETADSKLRRKASMLTLQYRANPSSEHASRERNTRGTTQPGNVANVKKQRSMPGLRLSSKKPPSVPPVSTSIVNTTPEVPPRKSSHRWFPNSDPKASVKKVAKAQTPTPTPPSRGRDVSSKSNSSQRAPVIDSRLRKQKSMPGLRPSGVAEVPAVPRRPRATSSVYSRSSSRSSVFVEFVEDAPGRISTKPAPYQISNERMRQPRTESRLERSYFGVAPGSQPRAKEAPASQKQPPEIPRKAESRRHDSGNITWRPSHQPTRSEAKVQAEVANPRTKQLRPSKSMPKLWFAKDSVSKIPRLNDLPRKPSIDTFGPPSTLANPRGTTNQTLKKKDSRLEVNRKRSMYFEGTAHRAEATMQIVDLYLDDEGEVSEVSPEAQRSTQSEGRKPRPSKRDTFARENDWKIPEKDVRELRSGQRKRTTESEPDPDSSDQRCQEDAIRQPVHTAHISGPQVALAGEAAATSGHPRSLRKTESSSRLWSTYRYGQNVSAPSTPAPKTLRRQESTPIIRLYRSADAPPVKERIAQWEESLLLPVLPTIRYARQDVSTPEKGLGISLNGRPEYSAFEAEEGTPSKTDHVVRSSCDGLGSAADAESPSAGRGLLVDSPRESEGSIASRSPDWPLRAV